jgi:hypothetical protein
MMDKIICIYCNQEIDIYENELYELFEEDGHNITCPNCNQEIYVNTSIKYSFEVGKVSCEDEDSNEEHEYELSGYSIYTTNNLDWDPGDKIPTNPPELWEYWKNFKCTKCDDTTFDVISKEEFYKDSGYNEEWILKHDFIPHNDFGPNK